MLLSYQGLVNCTSRFLQWTQSLVMRCYDMICIEIISICYVCYVDFQSADPTCGFVKSPWDSIAITESGHVSSLRFHVSLHLQCRCWIVLRIVKVSTSRCTHGWCTFLAAAPWSYNFHPWLAAIQFTGQCSNLLNHPTISLCYFWCLIVFCCLRDMSRKAHPWAFAAKIILILLKTWNGTRLSKSSEEWEAKKHQCDILRSSNVPGGSTPKNVVKNHGISLLIQPYATSSTLPWDLCPLQPAATFGLVRKPSPYNSWELSADRGSTIVSHAPIGANSCAEPAQSKRSHFEVCSSLLPLHCTLTSPHIRSAAAGTWGESGRVDLSPELFAVSQHVAFIFQRRRHLVYNAGRWPAKTSYETSRYASLSHLTCIIPHNRQQW